MGENESGFAVSFDFDVYEELLAEVCAAAFEPLSRSDQRERGTEFVRGLLTAQGRKSIRNIAVGLGGRAAHQRLHHFVSGSTWDWVQVRRALAEYRERVAPPEAWAVRHAMIPKSGHTTVGVERRYSSAHGRVVTAQYAVGLWGVSSAFCSPADWQLLLPGRSGQAAAQEGVLRIAQGAPQRWGLPSRPVLLDARGPDDRPRETARELALAGIPFLTRIGAQMQLLAYDANLRAQRPATAGALVSAAGRARKPVGTVLAAAVPVRLPGGPAADRVAAVLEQPLLLLGIGQVRRWPAQLWLTDLTQTAASRLVHWTGLAARLMAELDGPSARTGMYDFSGRSFDGWHRHMTLVSVARLVALLAERAGGSRGTYGHAEPADTADTADTAENSGAAVLEAA